jgi:hypothetical protein
LFSFVVSLFSGCSHGYRKAGILGVGHILQTDAGGIDRGDDACFKGGVAGDEIDGCAGLADEGASRVRQPWEWSGCQLCPAPDGPLA